MSQDTHSINHVGMAVYRIEAAAERFEAMRFVLTPRGKLGTRTATLHAEGIAKLRRCWIYRTEPSPL